MNIRRPLWRSFTQRYIKNAVEHVSAGGHAILWRSGSPKPSAWMLLPCGSDGALPELAFWSLLSLEKQRYQRVPRGPAKGLATARIPRDREWAVEEWCERDAKWPGSTRDVDLDCMTCAACCKNNRVILYEADIDGWDEAGRSDLSGKAYTRNSKGDVVLRLKADGDCVHLHGTLCGIYEMRPSNCSMFPAGSEPCLSSREEEFGLVD